MSLENRSLAYDLSVFEEVAPKRKKDNIVSLPQKKIREKRAYQQKRAKMVLVMAVAVVSFVSLLVTFTIINNQKNKYFSLMFQKGRGLCARTFLRPPDARSGAQLSTHVECGRQSWR